MEHKWAQKEHGALIQFKSGIMLFSLIETPLYTLGGVLLEDSGGFAAVRCDGKKVISVIGLFLVRFMDSIKCQTAVGFATKGLTETN